MKSKIFSFLKNIIPILFWCLIWELLSIAINNNFLLPSVGSTTKALFVLLTGSYFYKSVLLSLLRVTVGLFLGCLFGTLLAVVCHRFSIVNALFSPLISIIKATPVASFIVVLWVLMSGDALSVFVCFLMVMPIIWQNVTDGFISIDPKLSEVADIFEFSYTKRFKLLIFPALKKYLIPGVITASGLAWKAEIAAEIIAYTKNSIGQGINDAKYHLDTPTVFAWTVIIIIFSIILEKTTKHLIRRSKR